MQQVKTKDIAVIVLAIILVLFLWYRFVYSSMESQANKANQAAADAKTQSSVAPDAAAGADGQQREEDDPS